MALAEPAEVLQQLKAARQWLKFLIAEFDLDPDKAVVVFSVESPEGKREAARVTLAHSLAQIDAVLQSQDPTP